MQGASWLPLLKGTATDWRQAFMFVYLHERNLPATPAMVAVRTSTAKLISYPGHEDWTEMFDLSADPYEMNNLARSPEHAASLKRLQAELVAQKEKYGDPFAKGINAY
jgi:arylsulfatase A-like enzyme